jgi:hypothetical protein
VLGTDQPLDTLKKAERILGQFKGEVDQKQTPPPTVPPIAEPGSVAAVTDDQLIAQLPQLPWRENSKGNGHHCRLEDLALPFRAVLLNKFLNNPRKTLRLGDYNYSRFGDANDMLGRFPAKKDGEA